MSDKTADVAAPELAADLATLRADVARLSDTIVGLMRGGAEAAGAAVRGPLSQAASDAQDSALGAAANFERRIERNPLTAVLIAAGIGMALGMMSKSRG